MALTELQIEAVDVALRLNLPFVLYSLPMSSDAVFYADDGRSPMKSTRRFGIYPWRSQSGYMVADRLSADSVVTSVPVGYPTDAPSINAIPLRVSTKRDFYIKQVSELIRRLQVRDGKTVYSRVSCGGFKSDGSRLKAVETLFERPSANLSAVYYHPAVGAWLTATPEVLLDVDTVTGAFETMSLAGTRPIADSGMRWSDKNIEEQSIVTSYICHTLDSLMLSYSLDGPVTVDAGPVQHLRTLIHGTGVLFPAAIASRLSPTPALGGYPGKEALRDIDELESHPRRCYGGYIAITTQGHYRAFVNLRCAQFSMDRYCLYAGGGITPHSIPDDEWDETEIKLSRLLPLFDC